MSEQADEDPVSASPGAPAPATPRDGRLTEEELTRLRAKVDGGSQLDDAEAASLQTEMDRATDATKPAAAVLARAADEEARRVGYDLDYFTLEELWEADPGLRAVKRIYERERARWRRARGIVDEHGMLVDGEAVELDRRAPFRFDARRDRDKQRRRRFSLRRD